MKQLVTVVIFLTIFAAFTSAEAQVKLSGYFIAREECSAYHSFKRGTNPGNVMTEIDKAYDLIGKNKQSATHYLIKMDAKPNYRWVATGCGEHVIPADTTILTDTSPNDPSSDPDSRYVLAISWQPGFCETKPSKPECQSQTEDRFDAMHFTLHGLWPQPRGNQYCHISPEEVAKDKNKKWADLLELTLSEETRNELNKVMPGTQSFLHRHEWTKHGTCYNGETPDKYFSDSIMLMRALNNPGAPFHTLFADNIGKELTAAEISNAFDETFGDGTSDKIKISCSRDGDRLLITEITINLQGDLDEISMSEALFSAPNTNNRGCTMGIVDPVGFQ